jgi:carbon starvation protein
LIQGVRDPLGGINSLWPLFGIANQMLAAIALCLATTIILKMSLGAQSSSSARTGDLKRADSEIGAPLRTPWFALVTLVPLVWLLSVTFTAGVQKIWHPDPRIGFNAAADAAQKKREVLRSGLASVPEEKLAAQSKEMAQLVRQTFNARLDAFVAGGFLVLVSIIVLVSLREWLLLLSRRKPAVLRENEPVWLPDYAVAEASGKFGGVAGTAALTLALAKELSGEAHLERAQAAQAHECKCDRHAEAMQKSPEQLYVETTEQRFTGVRRCC